MSTITFALNHMTAPKLGLAAFMARAKTLGMPRVEIRNDLDGNAILDGTPAEAVKQMAKATDVEIVSINALQRFNDWSAEREVEAGELASYAAACGAKALVLVPTNDGSGLAEGERQGNLCKALRGLLPILEKHGIVGLVEPLGFASCSLRSKREAVAAIDEIGGRDRFRLVHDTFHHVLAGEAELFPDRTGLVHISGVDDSDVAVGDLRDLHRVMVGPNDRLDNVGQMRALRAAGYAGPFSFEPFAPSVHEAGDAVALVRESAAHILGALDAGEAKVRVSA